MGCFVLTVALVDLSVSPDCPNSSSQRSMCSQPEAFFLFTACLKKPGLYDTAATGCSNKPIHQQPLSSIFHAAHLVADTFCLKFLNYRCVCFVAPQNSGRDFFFPFIFKHIVCLNQSLCDIFVLKGC